jgi:hypothetical protein
MAAKRAENNPTAPEELEGAALAVVIVLGSAVLWMGIPLAVAWLAGRVTSNGVTSVLIALVAIPLSMGAFGWLLYRINERYETLRGTGRRPSAPPAWRGSLGEERAGLRRARASRRLIDVAMTVSAAAACVALVVWFFAFAELRLSPFP